MSGFLSFVKKEALHILRDPRTMLIVLLMPVVQILLFGFAISTEINNIDVAVVVPKPTESIRRAVERIDANEYFTLKGTIAQTDIDRVLRTGEAEVVVVFADDFDRQMAASAAQPSAAGAQPPTAAQTASVQASGTAQTAVQFVFDASNPNIASAGAGYLQGVLLTATQSAAANASQSASPETRLLFNPQMKSAYNFVPGIMGLIFILICAMMTSVSIVREKETGTMEVLLVSPIRPIWIVLAKMIPYFVLSCTNLLTILLLSNFVLDVPMSGNVMGIVAISLLYVLLSLALGLLISTLSNRQVTAMIISGMLFLLPVIMLSGMMFPIENMPGVLQAVSYIIPARWYIDAIRKLMIEGLPFGEVMTQFSILAAMTVVLVVVALKNFKDKLE